MNPIRNKAIITLVFLLTISKVIGQNLPVIVPQSPEAAALAKYSEYPVGSFTGIPSINVPLYTIQSGDIKIPIDLNYHSGGFRVNEEASWVGLGWTLSTGMMISRTIYGADDFTGQGTDQFNSGLAYHGAAPKIIDITGGNCGDNCDPTHSDGLNGFCNGSEYMGSYSSCRSNKPTVNGALLDYSSYAGTFFDWQPDIYSINIPGYCGKFVFDQDKNVYFLEKQDIRIIPITNGWKATTADGFEYYFTVKGTTVNEFGQELSSEWYLEKIKSPKNDSISLSYDMGDLIWQNSYSETGISTVGDNNSLRNFKSHVSGTRYKEIYLKRIEFAEGYVTFTPGGGREDLKGAQKLKSVEIFNKNEPIKKFEFVTSYFDSGDDRQGYMKGISPEDYTFYQKRLKLDTVIVKNGNKAEKYAFNYLSNPLPNKDAFSQDHWGYYNGKNNTQLIPAFEGDLYYTGKAAGSLNLYRNYFGADRSSNSNMLGCLLQEIVYPTGGRTTFEFEPNENGNIRLSETYTYESFNIGFDMVFDENGIVSSNHELPYYYSFPNDVLEIEDPVVTVSAIHWNDVISGGMNLPDTYYSEVDVGGVNYYGNPATFSRIYYLNNSYKGQVGTGSITDNISTELRNFYGPVTIRFNYPMAAPYLKMRYLVSFGGRKKKINISKKETVGGLRVKRITHKDGFNPLKDIVKTYDYSYQTTDTAGRVVKCSYGILKNPLRHYYSYNGSDYTEYCFTSSNVNSLSFTQSSHLGYSKITERIGENGENGKIVYNYYNYENKCFDHIYRPPSVPNSTQFLYDGKLMEKLTYNANNKLVSTVNYNYDLKEEKIIKGIYQDGNFSNGGDVSIPMYGAGGFHYYPIYSRWEALTSTDETIFGLRDNSKSLTTSTSFSYEGKNHIQPTKIFKSTSDNSLIMTSNQYAGDYKFSECEQNLKNCSVRYLQDINNCESSFMECYHLEDSLAGECNNNYYTCHNNIIDESSVSDVRDRVLFKYYPSLKKRYLGTGRVAKIQLNTLEQIYQFCNANSIPIYQLIVDEKQNEINDCASKYSDCRQGYIGPCWDSKALCKSGAQNLLYVCRKTYEICNSSYVGSLDNDAGILWKIGQKNPATLIESTVQKIDDNGVSVIDATLNKYDTLSSGAIIPKEMLKLKSNKPISDFSSSSFANAKFNYDSRYETRILLDYLPYAKLKTAKKINDAPTSYYWGYNNQYPVAKIEGILTYEDIKAAAGTYLDQLDDGLNNTQLAAINQSIRTALPNCMVSTFTYKPLVGILTQTDPSGKTIFYEYDDLGRLATVKDQDGVILKHMEYKYATGN